MTEKVLRRPFFSLRGERTIVAKKGNALFPQVIHEPTTFSLDVQNWHRVRLKATVYPPTPDTSPHIVFQTGGVLVVWQKGAIIATGDDPLENDGQDRRHELTGDRGTYTLAPATWSGPDDTSVDSLQIQLGASITEVIFGPHEFHLPFTLPQIVYSFSSPPRE